MSYHGSTWEPEHLMLNRVISTNTTAIVTCCSSRAWRSDWKHDARGRFGPWNHCVLKLCQFTQTERRCNWLHDKSLWIQWHPHTAVMKKERLKRNTSVTFGVKTWKPPIMLEVSTGCGFLLSELQLLSALHILPDSRAYILHTFLLSSPFFFFWQEKYFYSQSIMPQCSAVYLHTTT